jgi:hypothetical protein
MLHLRIVALEGRPDEQSKQEGGAKVHAKQSPRFVVARAVELE